MVDARALFAGDPRIRLRNDRPLDAGGTCVVYWMQRAQRGSDNAALDAAIEVANELKKPVVVHLGVVPTYPRSNERHLAFLLEGIDDVRRDVEKRGAAFASRPWPDHGLEPFCAAVRPCLVIGDENPLREPERWRRVLAERLPVALATVDADVVVPSALFAREEYGARTIRPKIQRVLDAFLTKAKEPKARVPVPAALHKRSTSDSTGPTDVRPLLARLPLDRSAAPVSSAFFRGGPRAAQKQLRRFLARGLAGYATRRNRPEDEEGTSRLSPWLHFGHLGPRMVALAVLEADAPAADKAAFLEQLIVRRELSINFVARNPHYDEFRSAHDWAKRTLREHRRDRRPYLYMEEELEHARTHDPLWNAAQQQMRVTGHMHNVLRMYWAKKILEWTRDPAAAFEIAVRLNDRWELDGRDPNGYTGIAWAIGGKHDRPWPKRKVFGTIRSMTFDSTSKKFDSRRYIAQVAALVAEHGA